MNRVTMNGVFVAGLILCVFSLTARAGSAGVKILTTMRPIRKAPCGITANCITSSTAAMR